MIEWLEEYLSASNITFLMVTHDRYFLDRVCNHIIEMDAGSLYHHKGNYAYYLNKKAEQEEVEQAGIRKAGQLYKKELEWMRRQPKARTSKSKSRIDAFYETKEKASRSKDTAELELEVSMQRIGGQVLEVEHISKAYGDTVLLQDFSYSFNKGERIGIIGSNGVGKSTFLKILTGETEPDEGVVKTGATIQFGHYRQQEISFEEGRRVIDVIKEVASVIVMADGSQLSASQFLEHFMFPGSLQYTPVEKLSGGERRRLALMMVLISNPNFLILDEPTNDLDLYTLQKLEEFLLGFGGCLIVVSHDRFFMDKLSDHYFVFEGNGVIRDHHGTYMEYRNMLKERESAEKKHQQSENEKKAPASTNKKSASAEENGDKPKKLTYNEQKEFSRLEKQIEKLETEKSGIEEKLGSGSLNPEEVRDLSERYASLNEEIDEKTVRWLDMAERADN